MAKTFRNLSTDTTLGGATPSDELAVSQKAIKEYVDQHGGGGSYTAGDGIDITNSVISVENPVYKNRDGTGVDGITIGRPELQYGDGDGAIIIGATTMLSPGRNIGGAVVIGGQAKTQWGGCIAIGGKANADGDVSIAIGGGSCAATGAGAIQLGFNQTNADDNTFKVANLNGNFEIMSADGTIPEARLASTTGTQQGDVLTLDANGDAVWQAAGGSSLPSQTGNAGKFLTTDGTDASWSDKPLVNGATGANSVMILPRNNAFGLSTRYAVSIGYNSIAFSENSVVVGVTCSSSSANYGIAIGYGASVGANNAIQLGGKGIPFTVNNSDANTFKVANANGNFEIMSADGTIPEGRLADTTNAAQGQVLTLDNNLNAVWAASGDVVVEKQDPTAANNYTWYRKYKSGWVEQGGVTSGGPAQVTLPVEMADTNYSIMGCSRQDSSGSGWFSAGVITTTGFGCNLQYGSGTQSSGTSIQWEVRGIAA